MRTSQLRMESVTSLELLVTVTSVRVSREEPFRSHLASKFCRISSVVHMLIFFSRWSRVSLLIQLNDPSQSNGFVAL